MPAVKFSCALISTQFAYLWTDTSFIKLTRPDMMFYFPFTFLPETLIKPLTAILGSVNLLAPLPKQMPPAVSEQVAAGTVHLCTPDGVDAARIDQALKQFTAWAALQGGKPGDLKRFFQSAQGLGAWHQGPPTAEIRAQLYRGADTPTSSSPMDSFLNAGVFLALAHDYDEQQEALVRDLGSVHTLERRFGEILGGASDRDTALGPNLKFAAADRATDPGAFMTAQRMQAWAELAIACGVPTTLLVTTSRAVWELFRDDFPESTHLFEATLDLTMDPDAGGPTSSEAWHSVFSALARAEDPYGVPLDRLAAAQNDQGNGARFDLCVLAGVPPQDMLARYTHRACASPEEPTERPIRNTLVAHLDVPMLSLGYA